MSETMKIVLTCAATAIAIAGMAIYFSPYHSCVRAGFDAPYCVAGVARAR